MGIGPKRTVANRRKRRKHRALPQSALHRHKGALNAPDIPQANDAARKR